MGLTVQANIGPSLYSDGVEQALRGEKSGALVIVEGAGKYREPTYRGTVFTASTGAAGVAVPIFSSTTQQAVLYNPLSSKKALALLRCDVGYVSGTGVAGHFVYAVQTTLANAVTGTGSTVLCNYIGAAGSIASFFTAATVVAFTYLRPMNVSQVAQAATATNAPWVMSDLIDGSIILPPGGALAVAGNAAAFVTAAVALTWEEISI